MQGPSKMKLAVLKQVLLATQRHEAGQGWKTEGLMFACVAGGGTG